MKAGSLTSRALGLVALYHLVRRQFYYRSSPKIRAEEQRNTFYRTVWEEAARTLGGTLSDIDPESFEVRCGAARIRVRGSLTSLDDPVTLRIANDKPLVHRLLMERGIPVPRHLACEPGDLQAAWGFAAALPGPSVVKPARDTDGGIGVTTGITQKHHLAIAMAYAASFRGGVLIEEQIQGALYRLLYFEGELLDAVQRSAPTIRGDGTSTIQELVRRENAERLRQGTEAGQSLIGVDSDLKHTLRNSGYHLGSVPAADVTVRLKRVVNDNRRDHNESAADRLSPSIIETGREAVAAVGARLAGVDVITPDPTVALSESGGRVIELNTAPGYYYHYYKKDGRTPVASLILERVMRGTGS